MGNDFNQNTKYTYVSGLGFFSQTPQQYERRKLMIQYNILIFTVILLCMLRDMLVWPIVRVLDFIGFNVTVDMANGSITMSQSSSQVFNIVLLVMYMYIPTLILVQFNKRNNYFVNCMKTPAKYTTRFGVFIILSVSVVAQSMVFVIKESLNFVGIVFSSQDIQPPTEFRAFVLFVLFMTIIPAFFEEYLFRGIMTTSLRFFGDLIAIVIPTILYTLIQPSFDKMAFAFIMGLTFGYFTLKSGSIVVSFIGNFLSKGVMLMISIEKLSFSGDSLYSTFRFFTNATILFLGIICFTLFIHKDKNAFKIFNGDTYLLNRVKLKLLFSSFSFWCLVGITFLTAISYIQIIG